MPLTGKGKLRVFVLPEAPGETEDVMNTQLVGACGTYLRRRLHKLDIDLDRDCWKRNAVNCRPPKNRPPSSWEIECCRTLVWNDLKENKPKVILALGGAAVESILGHRWHKDMGGITQWRGWCIPDKELNAWVCPTYHPSYIMAHAPPVAEVIFMQDLERAFSMLDRKIPTTKDYEKKVCVLTDVESATACLLDILAAKPPLLAFDYETTGKKPHAQGHAIKTCAMCWHPKEAFAFPMFEQNTFRVALKRVLRHPSIGKIACNLNFEELWTRVVLGYGVLPWSWDVMLASHIIDNRHSVTGLKFQVYANFGIPDYDSEVEGLLKTSENNDNAFNRIDEIPLKTLLLYNGLDALFTRKLASVQRMIIE